ncbi:dienelactone hydrolase family protein [Streptomyces sp. NPDC056190]|uniref:dienelactone hydrolase family protein n=1 Tax=unclassified Streptomyces TaxID=2593676 RepID=UPI0035E1F692
MIDLQELLGRVALGIESHLDVEAAGLEHEIVVFPGVNHAFFNDTGSNHNANAAAQAYDRVLDWFGRFVDRGGQGG